MPPRGLRTPTDTAQNRSSNRFRTKTNENREETPRNQANFNEFLEPFHDRCPLILEPNDYERWLAPAEPSHLPIDLVRTYPSERMKAWRVAKLSGNGPELITPLEAPKADTQIGLF